MDVVCWKFEADVTILSFNNLITYNPTTNTEEEKKVNTNNKEGSNKKSNIAKIDDDNQNPIKLLPIVGKVYPCFSISNFLKLLFFIFRQNVVCLINKKGNIIYQ